MKIELNSESGELKLKATNECDRDILTELYAKSRLANYIILGDVRQPIEKIWTCPDPLASYDTPEAIDRLLTENRELKAQQPARS